MIISRSLSCLAIGNLETNQIGMQAILCQEKSHILYRQKFAKLAYSGFTSRTVDTRVESLNDKWRRVAAVLRRHPTLGKEAKLSLATAKDTIVKWFEDTSSSDPHQSSAVPNKPLPGAGDADDALPLPMVPRF